jgi:hypothetical protein
MFALPPADTPCRNCPGKRTPRLVAATAALMLVGIVNPAAVHANEPATLGAATAAPEHDLAGNPAHSDTGTATTMRTPAAEPGAPTAHVILTGCVPGLNC